MSTDARKDPGVNPFLLNAEIKRAVARLNGWDAIKLELPANDIWIDANSEVFNSAVFCITEVGLQGDAVFQIKAAPASLEEVSSASSYSDHWMRDNDWMCVSFGPLGPPFSDNVKNLFDPFFFPNAQLQLSTFNGCIKANGGLLNVVGDARHIVIHAYHRIAKMPGSNHSKGTSNV